MSSLTSENHSDLTDPSTLSSAHTFSRKPFLSTKVLRGLSYPLVHKTEHVIRTLGNYSLIAEYILDVLVQSINSLWGILILIIME